jgi:6-phosphofructokinase
MAMCNCPAPARWPTCSATRSRKSSSIKRVRGDTFGYLQRSFMGCVSDVDQREAREVGEKAVQYAMWGDKDGSVAIKRTGFYSVDYQLVPLESVAGKTRVMEDEFIAASGTDVTDAFRSICGHCLVLACRTPTGCA